MLLLLKLYFDKNIINRIIWLTIFFILLFSLIDYFGQKSNLIDSITRIIIVLLVFIIVASSILYFVNLLTAHTLLFGRQDIDKFERYSMSMAIVIYFSYWIIKTIIKLEDVVLYHFKNKIKNKYDNLYYNLVFRERMITKSI